MAELYFLSSLLKMNLLPHYYRPYSLNYLSVAEPMSKIVVFQLFHKTKLKKYFIINFNIYHNCGLLLRTTFQYSFAYLLG